MEKTLQEQLLNYYAKTTAASDMYYSKSDKIYDFGYQGTENLSPEGVGGYVALGGLVAKLAYAGAQIANAVVDLPQGFSNTLDAASLPFNAVAGVVFAAGASLLAGTVIKDAIASRVADKANIISEHSVYASAAYHAIKSGKLNLPENATLEEAIVAAREQQVAEHLSKGGSEEDVESFYPEVDFEKVEGFMSKLEKNKPEEFAAASAEALRQFKQNEADFEAMVASSTDDMVQA